MRGEAPIAVDFVIRAERTSSGKMGDNVLTP